MSLIVKESEKTRIPNLEDGVYSAVSSMIIDLGIQRNERFDKDQRKFLMVWEIVGETITIGEEVLPRIISKEYTYSLGEKSNLKKDLEAWRGQAFTEEELKGFNLLNVLNKGCQLQIINKENNGTTYNNIAGIMALAKGMKIEPLEKTTVFDTEEPETWEAFDNLPLWIQEKIKKAINLSETGLDDYITEYEKAKKEAEDAAEVKTNEDIIKNDDDDLPF